MDVLWENPGEQIVVSWHLTFMIHYPLKRAILVQVMLQVRVGIPIISVSKGLALMLAMVRVDLEIIWPGALHLAGLSEVSLHLIDLVRIGFSTFHSVKWNYPHRRLWRVCKMFV